MRNGFEHVCKFSPVTGLTATERYREVVSFSFQLQYTVYSWQVKVGTADRYRYDSLHAVTPEASADVMILVIIRIINLIIIIIINIYYNYSLLLLLLVSLLWLLIIINMLY